MNYSTLAVSELLRLQVRGFAEVVNGEIESAGNMFEVVPFAEVSMAKVDQVEYIEDFLSSIEDILTSSSQDQERALLGLGRVVWAAVREHYQELANQKEIDLQAEIDGRNIHGQCTGCVTSCEECA